MKNKALFPFLMAPVVALAQSPQGMSEQDMQKMMQQAQEMQACMQKIDQSEMDALQAQSNKISTEIRALCAKGKRDAAEKKAMSYGMKMSKDPTVKALRKCGEMMKGAMPKMPYVVEDANRKGHVCD